MCDDGGMDERGAGRYAPSPSGALHLGNLRTAMLAWLFARSSNRRFLIRIEDADRERDAGAAAAQLADLREIGIDWDAEPVIQSERREAHTAAITRLREMGLVYECTCTRREIHEAPSAPHVAPGAYPNTCRNRTEEERLVARMKISPRLPALRLRVPENMREQAFEDRLLGTVSTPVDDFVLQRGDGAIAYNLAVTVDDAAAGVDQVVRGDDLAGSTSRQIVLQRLLGLASPPQVEYAHVPLVLGPTGARLAKRDGAVTLSDLAADGVTSSQVRAALARSLNMASPSEQPSMQQLLERFDASALPREPWIWDSGWLG